MSRNNSIITVDRSGVGAIYSGLAIAVNDSKQAFLYAADDGPNRRVDMFDSSFNLVKSFNDPEIPQDFAPYGIQAINGQIWVTYTSLKKAQSGFVDVFDTAGILANHFYQSLLKSATAKAGHRYSPPPNLHDRLVRQIRLKVPPRHASYRGIAFQARRGFNLYGWTTALALLVVCVGIVLVQRNASRSAMVASEKLALATEACDQHIATLAANTPPQVISSDRHTVKPWFEGKLPFSFNLPENLPTGTYLDGANFTYIHNRPAAQLLYSIGKHRVSIYLAQGRDSNVAKVTSTDHLGFHVISFSILEIAGVAVSDVDPSRLSELVALLTQAQK